MTFRISCILFSAVLAASCGQPRSDVEILFTAGYANAPVSCSSGPGPVSLTDLRFFVHDVELRSTTGEWRRLNLDVDPTWQQADLAMIDLEDASAGCMNGTAETRAAIAGSIRGGEYRGIRFTLGVPFDRNHADPLTAAGPLDDSAMHWHWRSGYKFLRAGVETADDGFWIHLGSTGCEGTVGNITGCRSPNRVQVELGEFAPGSSEIIVDLEALLDGTDLGDSVPGDCSSAPSEVSCSAPFAALGLDFEAGTPLPVQHLFKLGTR